MQPVLLSVAFWRPAASPLCGLDALYAAVGAPAATRLPLDRFTADLAHPACLIDTTVQFTASMNAKNETGEVFA